MRSLAGPGLPNTSTTRGGLARFPLCKSDASLLHHQQLSMHALTNMHEKCACRRRCMHLRMHGALGSDDGTRCNNSRLWSAAFWGTRDDLLPWRLTQHPSPHGKTQLCHPVSAVSRFKLASLASLNPLSSSPPSRPPPCSAHPASLLSPPRPPASPPPARSPPAASSRRASPPLCKLREQGQCAPVCGADVMCFRPSHYPTNRAFQKSLFATMAADLPAPAPPWSPAPSTRRRSPPPPSSSRSPRWCV